MIQEVSLSNVALLCSHLILPNFDVNSFPLAIDYGYDEFKLVNLRTGNADTLISASGHNDNRYASSYF